MNDVTRRPARRPRSERGTRTRAARRTGGSREAPSKLLWFEERWKAILGIPSAFLALAVAWFAFHDRIWPPPPRTDLVIASFDARSVLEEASFAYQDPEVKEGAEGRGRVELVSIGLRNRGDAPVFLTGAVFTFRAHTTLSSCVGFGDALYASQKIDVDVPLEASSVPWVLEMPISHQVDPNALDRLEFRFGSTGVPVFVEPAVISVDIALEQDDATDLTPAGSARLVVPAISALTSLIGLTEEPPAEPREGCSTGNLEHMRRVLETPTLPRADSSPLFDELLGALEKYEEGVFYVRPETEGS
ncbi:hypothetical protein [Oerskovia turbata]